MASVISSSRRERRVLEAHRVVLTARQHCVVELVLAPDELHVREQRRVTREIQHPVADIDDVAAGHAARHARTVLGECHAHLAERQRE